LDRAVVTVLEPASERGQAGISELQKQSANLLSFQPLPKAVFDAQLAFNVLPEYGEDAPLALQTVEDRISRDLAALGSGDRVSLRRSRCYEKHKAGWDYAGCSAARRRGMRLPCGGQGRPGTEDRQDDLRAGVAQQYSKVPPDRQDSSGHREGVHRSHAVSDR